MQKKELLICAIVFALLIALNIFILMPKDYKVNYVVDDIKIEEAYNKKENYYIFRTKVRDIDFESVVFGDKVRGKRLIENVKTFEDNSVFCLYLESSSLETYPICHTDEGYVDIDLIDQDVEDFFVREETEQESREYKNIKLDSLMDKKLLVWAQKGYYLLGSNGQQEIMFLKEESYYNSLPYQVDEFVLTPNYDEDYTFSRFYVLDMETGKLSNWDIDFKINFNSYYLGTKDSIAYLFDRKEKVEYAIDVKHKKIEIVSENGEAKVWSGEWESISTGKLANDDYMFESEEVFSYESELGLKRRFKNGSNSFKISRKAVDSIVAYREDGVYYLVKNQLFAYNPKYGEILMAEYREWDFNYKNSIFIY